LPHGRRQSTGKRPLPPTEPATCPQFGPRGSIRYDARPYRLLALDRVSLHTMQGRITCRLLPGKLQHDQLSDPDWTVGGAELVWQRGVYSLHVTQHREATPAGETTDLLGLDLGVVNVATDSEGEQFTGVLVRQKRSPYVAPVPPHGV
jgi:putative transposase